MPRLKLTTQRGPSLASNRMPSHRRLKRRQRLSVTPASWIRLATLFLAVAAALTLLACSQTEPTATPTPVPTATPTPIASPTPTISLGDISLPSPEPNRLAALTQLLSLVPEDYTSALILDLKALEDSPLLREAVGPRQLGIPAIVPPEAIDLLDAIGVAAGEGGQGAIAILSGTLDVASLLQLAGSFGLTVEIPEPETHRSHQVWGLEVFGLTLAVAQPAARTVVLSSGTASSSASALDVVKASLDTFDGVNPGILDNPDHLRLVNTLPSGFAALLTAKCGEQAVLGTILDFPGCTGAAISAAASGEDEVVFYGLVSFTDDSAAAAALQIALERLEAERELLPGEVTAGQEGELVWAKVLVEAEKVVEAIESLTAP